MRALVTGASGFVGSALCRELARAGHQVVGLTRDPERAARRVGAGATFERAGVADPRAIAAKARGCDVLFHAAGIAALDAPARVLRWVHVAGTENVLRAARHAGVKRVVHISCADVTLHDGDRMHWDERRALPQKPEGPHAQTKLMAEELALASSDEKMEVTALRPALLWGVDDVDGVAALLRESRTGGVVLYGAGRNVLATTHIDNLVKAALRAADAPEARSRAYYLTDGEFLEARELYTKLLAATGLPIKFASANLGIALARAKLRELISGDRSARARVLRRGTNALFDVSRATQDLEYVAHVDLQAALGALAEWVNREGGAEAIAARASRPPTETDVEEQIRAAGGD